MAPTTLQREKITKDCQQTSQVHCSHDKISAYLKDEKPRYHLTDIHKDSIQNTSLRFKPFIFFMNQQYLKKETLQIIWQRRGFHVVTMSLINL